MTGYPCCRLPRSIPHLLPLLTAIDHCKLLVQVLEYVIWNLEVLIMSGFSDHDHERQKMSMGGSFLVGANIMFRAIF
jgi:hypothetical protein